MHNYPKSNWPGQKAIIEATTLSENMLKIAERGFLDCEEDSCILLYGLIRDYGYKIRRTVEQEQFGQNKGGCHKTLN
jgi:hypothetical protein